MELPASSSLHFLNLDGEDILAPDEWTLAFVEAQVENWRETSLYCKPLGELELIERRFGTTWRVVAWPRGHVLIPAPIISPYAEIHTCFLNRRSVYSPKRSRMRRMRIC